METPVSFSKTQKCLSEMKILRPWASLGDIDNFEKAVYDMIQPNEKRGHTGILSNDSLIIESHANKYYSVTPRYELKISYLGKIPESIKNVMKLK
jgi:Holliday junction resolvase RusA-like endonuclease